MLAALSDRPPSLADLLGPYFVVLTTPQVADATLEVQVCVRGGGAGDYWAWDEALREGGGRGRGGGGTLGC